MFMYLLYSKNTDNIYDKGNLRNKSRIETTAIMRFTIVVMVMIMIAILILCTVVIIFI